MNAPLKETVTVTVTQSVGYRGKSGEKSYIAAISGTDRKYIFARSFVDTECTDKGEMFTARRKGKGAWQEAAALECGLYEICRHGERSYLLIWRKDEEVVSTRVDADRAQAVALLLDDGVPFEEARDRTKPAPMPVSN